MATGDLSEQLGWLCSNMETLTQWVAQTGARARWWDQHGNWQQRSARFDPRTSPYCTLLLERRDVQACTQQFCLVEVFAEAVVSSDAAEIAAPFAALGCIKLTRFPYDRALSSLPQVLRQAGQVEVVRYRPHKRCTLRVVDHGGAVAFVKVFPDQRGAAVHAAALALWDVRQRGDLGFHVAPPLRWDAQTQALWQGPAPGEPALAALASPMGGEIAQRLGRALGTLANASLPADETYPPDWQLRRSARYVLELRAKVPQAAAALDLLMARFERAHADLTARALRPIHGAPHPQQWLVSREACSLVDFDRCGHGDVELDVATFLAEIDFEQPNRFHIARINQGFVAGFESVAGPLDAQRLALYRAHKHLAKALRHARSLSVDGVERAAALIERITVAAGTNALAA